MTVKELIEKLLEFPKDAKVTLEIEYDGGFNTVSTTGENELKVVDFPEWNEVTISNT